MDSKSQNLLLPCQGHFWLPTTPTSRVPGRLTTLDDGLLQLDVWGDLTTTNDMLHSEACPLILGESASGQPLTLEDCFYKQAHLYASGTRSFSFHVNRLLIGCHTVGGDPIAFHGISFQSKAVDEWFRLNRISVARDIRAGTGTLSFARPAHAEYALDDHTKLVVLCAWTAPMTDQFRSATISASSRLLIYSTEPKSLAMWLDTGNRLRNFVSLIVDQYVPLESVWAHVIERKSDHGNREYEVKVLFAPAVRSSEGSPMSGSRSPLFTFAEVEQTFGRLLGRWFDSYQKADAAFNLYFAAKSGPDLYLTNRFLMMAQAAETLHRRTFEQKGPLSDADFSELTAILENAVPQKYGNWLKAKLRYGNEPFLAKRLNALVDEIAQVFVNQLKPHAFVSAIVDTRNYLTHYDAALHGRAKHGDEFYALYRVLEILVRLRLAMLCGFSADDIERFCSKSDEIGGALRSLTQLFHKPH